MLKIIYILLTLVSTIIFKTEAKQTKEQLLQSHIKQLKLKDIKRPKLNTKSKNKQTSSESSKAKKTDSSSTSGSTEDQQTNKQIDSSYINPPNINPPKLNKSQNNQTLLESFTTAKTEMPNIKSSIAEKTDSPSTSGPKPSVTSGSLVVSSKNPKFIQTPYIYNTSSTPLDPSTEISEPEPSTDETSNFADVRLPQHFLPQYGEKLSRKNPLSSHLYKLSKNNPIVIRHYKL